MAEGRTRANNKKLKKQLEDFPSGKLKDLTDAYVYCLRLVKMYCSKEIIKNIKDKYAELKKAKDGASIQYWKDHFKENEDEDDPLRGF